MREQKELFEISLMNLGNYNWEYFKISCLEDLKEAEEVINPHGINDTEIQLIEDYIGLYKYNFEVLDFLRIYEDYNISPEDLGALMVSHTVSEVREILERGIFYTIIEADTETEAFREYIMDYNALDIPQHLEDYIDYNSILIDWTAGGFKVCKVAEASKTVRSNKYLLMDCY